MVLTSKHCHMTRAKYTKEDITQSILVSIFHDGEVVRNPTHSKSNSQSRLHKPLLWWTKWDTCHRQIAPHIRSPMLQTRLKSSSYGASTVKMPREFKRALESGTLTRGEANRRKLGDTSVQTTAYLIRPDTYDDGDADGDSDGEGEAMARGRRRRQGRRLRRRRRRGRRRRRRARRPP
jgi:hypothetical protein